MAFGFVRLPLDSVGKKLRTRNRTIGSDDVHEQYVIAWLHDRKITTKYIYATASLVIAAAADAANVGRVYIENDQSSPVLIAVTKIWFRSQMASVLATPTSPRIQVKRFTFTGTAPSGTALVGDKLDTLMSNKSADWEVRTALTGMTVTSEAAGAICTFYPVASHTAVGASTPVSDMWEADDDDPVILRAGEGLMVKQSDAATTSDTRLFQLGFEIEEFVQEA